MVPKGELLEPWESLQTHCIHIKLFLPSEDAFESNKNCFTFKIKNQLYRVPWLKSYFYLWFHLFLKEFNSPFFKVLLQILGDSLGGSFHNPNCFPMLLFLFHFRFYIYSIPFSFSELTCPHLFSGF